MGISHIVIKLKAEDCHEPHGSRNDEKENKQIINNKQLKHYNYELVERSDKPPFSKGRFGGNVKMKFSS